jgi:hypothetical protein
VQYEQGDLLEAKSNSNILLDPSVGLSNVLFERRVVEARVDLSNSVLDRSAVGDLLSIRRLSIMSKLGSSSQSRIRTGDDHWTFHP